MSAVFVSGLSKSYGSLRVLRDIHLPIESGDFTVLLGPSGCGKSTLLNAVAGLEDIDSGTIEIDGADVTHREPSKRGIAMVFQSYALYPTMSVRKNLSFGLRVRSVPRAEVARRVEWAAKLLQITELLDRKPSQLSGGQRQRVAIGRALVQNAKVFLFDEPLSNLDAKLRTEMRVGAQTPASGAWGHHRLRHPRSDRGHDLGHAYRRHARRPHRAVCCA